ncbi:MAG: hypothetical protein K0R75_377 [Paenibacillaceae bacterium]|nr:hypothetical protein [Paenibacillaceae bacterium]
MNRLPWKPLLWTFANVLLLISLFSPIIVLTLTFIMLPIVVLFVILPLRQFILYYAAGLVLLAAVFPKIGMIAVTASLFFLPTAVVMGMMYRKRATAKRTLMTGTLTLLGQLLLTLVIVTVFGENVVADMRQVINDSMALLAPYMPGYISDETLTKLVDMIIQLLPLYFICFSSYFVVVTHVIARAVLNRNGAKIPGMRPIREWMLPKSLVWYFLIAVILDFVLGHNNGSMITMVLWNLIPLLTLAFSIQAIAFLFFVANANKWNRSLPIIGIALLVLFPFMQYILSMLGVLDVAFPLRDRMIRKS